MEVSEPALKHRKMEVEEEDGILLNALEEEPPAPHPVCCFSFAVSLPFVLTFCLLIRWTFKRSCFCL